MASSKPATAGHGLATALLAKIQWRYPNEQFAYLAQRVVEQTCVALARDAVRLTGLDRLALAGGVMSNIRAARRIRLLPEVTGRATCFRTWATVGSRSARR